jgi:hypothetical protein
MTDKNTDSHRKLSTEPLVLHKPLPLFHLQQISERADTFLD